jgi:hypothetical protein
VSGFLGGFASERDALLSLVSDVEEAWNGFSGSAVAETVPGGFDEVEETTGVEDTAGLIAQELSAVRETVGGKRLDIGVFGLIKRGKSTLLNALLGRAVSATAVTPETAVPVYVEHGSPPSATVHFVDGRVEEMGVDEARQYTSQESNRNNELGVTYVRVQAPSEFLANGVRMIDTPGLDDAEADEIYTERTIQELDSVDVGIVVLLSPPTIGATEVEFLREVVNRRLDKLLIVVNMYPQHFYSVDSRRDILRYIRERLAETTDQDLPLFPVCALDAWEARRIGFEKRWEDSGVADLLIELESGLTTGAGASAVATAASRLERAIELAQREVRVRRDLLADPEKLTAYAHNARHRIEEFRHDLEAEVETRLARVEPLRIQHRSLLLSIFFSAKERIRQTKDLDELEQQLRRFRREAEVAGNRATQQFREQMGGLLEGLTADLDERSEAVLASLHEDLAESSTTTSLFDGLEQDPRINPEIGGAAFGGLIAGGAGIAALGLALGPLGLVGGALVGWRLGGVVRSHRELNEAREVALERLDQIADEFAGEFDRQADLYVASVHEAIRRRPAGLSTDLEAQLETVAHLADDPQLVEDRRQESERVLKELHELQHRAQSLASGLDELEGVTV